MPHKEMWEGFFDPAQILAVMGLGEDVTDAVEFGCGYGTFTIPAAKVMRGTVHAIDIDAGMIAKTKEAADQGRPEKHPYHTARFYGKRDRAQRRKHGLRHAV